MKDTIIDKVEYRTSKNGKKGKKAIMVRMNGKWALLAEANIAAFKEIEGDISEDTAKCGIWEVMRYLGLEIAEGITKARNEAYNHILAAEEKRALRKCAIYDKGEKTFIENETAKIASKWERLTDFVTAYRKAQADAVTEGDTETEAE